MIIVTHFYGVFSSWQTVKKHVTIDEFNDIFLKEF